MLSSKILLTLHSIFYVMMDRNENFETPLRDAKKTARSFHSRLCRNHPFYFPTDAAC